MVFFNTPGVLASSCTPTEAKSREEPAQSPERANPLTSKEGVLLSDMGPAQEWDQANRITTLSLQRQAQRVRESIRI
jgi:hypothetical protein